MTDKLERYKDDRWDHLPNEWQYVHVRVLQDIRDELKLMNSVLQCSNTQLIPAYLRKIMRNTTKPKRKRKK